MTKTAIHVDHIARVEGQGNVHVVIEDGAVKTVEMNVVEPARLFESMVRGRSCARGVLHLLAHLRHLLGQPRGHRPQGHRAHLRGAGRRARTRALRELLVYGSYLQNHATHLFVLAAPDFVGQKSVFPLAESDPALFEGALEPEGARQRAVHGRGRPVHPPHHGGGGRLHPRDQGRGSTCALADKMDAVRGVRGSRRWTCSTRLRRCRDIATEPATCWPWWMADYYPVECSDTARFLNSRASSSMRTTWATHTGGVRRAAFRRAARRA